MQKKRVVNSIFVIFASKLLNMTSQKWIEDRAIHGYPTYSVEDVRVKEYVTVDKMAKEVYLRVSVL